MAKMDLKPRHVSWFGNMYQKFETICYEVDNIVNQDAAKCVENQVQSMGQCMKKLYSGVVQDLAPPSADPVPPEVDLEHQPRDSAIDLLKSMTGAGKHSGYSVRKNQSSVVPGDSDPSRDQTFHSPGDSVTHVSQMESGSTSVVLSNVSADNDSATKSAEEVDTKIKSLESKLMRANSAIQKESFEGFFSRKPLNCDSESRDACPKANSVGTSINGLKLPFEKGPSNNVIISANRNGIWTVEGEEELYVKSSATELLELSTSDKIALSEASFCSERISSATENKSGTVGEYSAETSCDEEGRQSFQVAGTVDGSPSNDSSHINDSATAAPLSEPGISGSISNTEFEEMDSLSSRSPDFTGLHSLSEKSNDSIPQSEPLAFGKSDDYLPSATFLPAVSFNSHVAGVRLGTSYSAFPLEPLDQSVSCSCGTDIVNDSEMETIDLYDKLKLEDSCGIVDDKILHDVSRRTRKLRSFKQKMQDLFAPKKMLIKEYETLSIWYGDSDIESSKQTQMSPSNTLGDKQAQPTHDSEWELL